MAGDSGFWPRSCGAGLTLLAAFGIAACSAEPGQENESGASEQVGSAAQAITVSGSALLVVGNATLGSGDAALKQRLTALGLTVTVKTATAVTTADATGKLVVISESVTSTDVNTKFRNSASPVINMEPALFDDLAMTGTPTSEYGITANQTSILLLGTGGTLVSDVTVPLTSSAKGFGWGRPGANAKRVATLAADTSASTIFAYDKGATMVGLAAPGRRVGWCATGDAAASFNTSAWNLFDASIAWAAAAGSQQCGGAPVNVCGGCTPISGTLGASCGACSVTACSADKNSLVCTSECSGGQVCVSGLNQCKTPDCSAVNSCGMSDGAGGICTNTNGKCPVKPNSAGACSGSSCVYTCNPGYAASTLSCSTASQPACGSWNFESNTTEGWFVKSSGSSNAAIGSLYLATPPGGGAAYGAHSLALNVDGTSLAAGYVTVSVNFCPGSAPATGIQGAFRPKIWFQPTDGNGAPSGPAYTYLNVNGGSDYSTPANVWFDAPTNNAMGANVTYVDLSIGGLEGHKGVLYFDNMHFD